MSTQAWRDAHQEEMKTYRRTHYKNNKAAYIARAKEQKVELRKWLWFIKRSLGCARCPENHPACLDFHHVDPKTKSIGINRAAFNKGWGRAKILAEMAKCILLCANC